jgi:hypothetical protein
LWTVVLELTQNPVRRPFESDITVLGRQMDPMPTP